MIQAREIGVISLPHHSVWFKDVHKIKAGPIRMNPEAFAAECLFKIKAKIEANAVKAW